MLGLKGSQAPPAFEGLKFVSASLEAAKKSLPEHRFDGGPRDTKCIGERGIENAEAKRVKRQKTRFRILGFLLYLCWSSGLI